MMSGDKPSLIETHLLTTQQIANPSGRANAISPVTPTINENLSQQALTLLNHLNNPDLTEEALINVFNQQKNLFCQRWWKNKYEKDQATNKAILEEITYYLLKNAPHINHDTILNNLNRLCLHQKKQQKQTFSSPNQLNFNLDAKLIKWLQSLTLLHQTLNTAAYQQTLATIDIFKTKAKRSFSDTAFRSLRMFLMGSGTASCIFNLGPMLILGVLGFCGVALPVFFIPALTITFGVIGIGMGISVLYGNKKRFAHEDTMLATEINNMKKQVNDLAQQTTVFKRKISSLENKYQSLINQYPEFSTHEASAAYSSSRKQALSSSDTTPRYERYNSLWLDVLGSFLGGTGASWGIPSLILGLCGITLLSAGAFGPIGLAVAGAALTIGVAYAVKTYYFEKKSRKNYAELHHIKTEQIATLKKELSETEDYHQQLSNDVKVLENSIKTKEVLLSKAAQNIETFSKAPQSPIFKSKQPKTPYHACGHLTLFPEKNDKEYSQHPSNTNGKQTENLSPQSMMPAC